MAMKQIQSDRLHGGSEEEYEKEVKALLKELMRRDNTDEKVAMSLRAIRRHLTDQDNKAALRELKKLWVSIKMGPWKR